MLTDVKYSGIGSKLVFSVHPIHSPRSYVDIYGYTAFAAAKKPPKDTSTDHPHYTTSSPIKKTPQHQSVTFCTLLHDSHRTIYLQCTSAQQQTRHFLLTVA
jgi:hypothetical protein